MLDVGIASSVVTIMIILSGIAIGVGKAIGSKRLELFGVEELAQAILNAAIIGVFAVIVTTITQVSTSIDFLTCGAGLPEELQCQMASVENASFSLMAESEKTALTLGYYESLLLHFGSFDIQILKGLRPMSETLGEGVKMLSINSTFAVMNSQLANFIAQTMLEVFLPLGIIFRSFFATRKIGGFLIGTAIGFYLLFPYFVLIVPSPLPILDSVVMSFKTINEKPEYATMPIAELNDNNAVAEKLYGLSTGDFIGDLLVAIKGLADANGALLLYVIVGPVIALAANIVFMLAVTEMLGAHFVLNVGVV
ncbi:MAG: hypothetical protein ACPL06_01470 [Candidatus Anstonellales archaeon]